MGVFLGHTVRLVLRYNTYFNYISYCMKTIDIDTDGVLWEFEGVWCGWTSDKEYDSTPMKMMKFMLVTELDF